MFKVSLQRLSQLTTGLLRRRQLDRDLEDEIAFHKALLEEKLTASGMKAEDVTAAAKRKFGRPTAVKEATRDVRTFFWLETLAQDLRYAFRQFRLRPGLTLVVVLSITCGIGINTAIFGVINALLLKSLPVHNPEELVQLNSVNLQSVPSLQGYSYPGFQLLRKASRPVLAGIFAYAASDTSSSVSSTLKKCFISYRGNSGIASGMLASADMYTVLGVEPVAGRLLVADDDRVEGGSPVLVLSYRYWQVRFGGDQAIVGKAVTVNNVPFTIIGVTPLAFHGVELDSAPDFTMPLSMAAALHIGSLRNGGNWWLGILARKKPGISDKQVESTLQSAFHHAVNDLIESTPAAMAPDIRKMVSGLILKIDPAGQGVNAEVREVLRRSFIYLMAMVILLLGIACANIANLVLAVTATRRNEIRLRMFLGASSARISRQLFTENLLLALIGGACSLPFTSWGGFLLVSMFADESVAYALDWHPDWRIFVFTFFTTVLVGIFTGVAPALQSATARLGNVIQKHRSNPRARAAPFVLVVAQIGIALPLLVGAGLLVRSFQNIRHIDSGFRPDKVLFFNLSPSVAGYSNARAQQLFEKLAEWLKQLPQVDAISFARFSPGSNAMGTLVQIAGDRPRSTEEESVGANIVGSSYFQTVGIDLVLGRSLDLYDTANAAPVAVVNQSFTRQYFGASNPLGRNFTISGSRKGPIEIVGVVKDLKEHGLLASTPRMIYLPYRQEPGGDMTFFIRTPLDPIGLLPVVGRELKTLDPLVPLTGAGTLDRQLNESVAREYMLAVLSSIMGLLALALAAIGLYSVLAYNVTRETKSIGIRIALGAEVGEVLWNVFQRVIPIVLSGLGIGLVAVLGLGRYLQSFLYGLTPADPTSIAASSFILLVVALMSAYLPARRAARINPATALRQE